MKTEIKKFVCTTKTDCTETTSMFTAAIKASFGKRYVLNVESVRFENGLKVSDASSNQYFDTYEELKRSMEYHFLQCKKNLFTTDINVIL